MPELPEVETTRRGISPHILGQTLLRAVVRQPQLRWPVPLTIAEDLPGQCLERLVRRGKYLLLSFETGTLILHLGMSGSLRILGPDTPAQKHDHFDLVFANGKVLRLRDPRRFGAVLWTGDDPYAHALLRGLGPEPLDDSFDGAYLLAQARPRRVAVKNLIMDARVVVGVGNIYANEALFRAGIHPNRACNRISPVRHLRLADSIKQVLTQAIEQGGTTLRDFQQEDGRPGYFAQQLQVYGRTNEPCPTCGAPLRVQVVGQRSTFYCSHCQR
jgi:formamidopyrimidine-DNA glycosylase